MEYNTCTNAEKEREREREVIISSGNNSQIDGERREFKRLLLVPTDLQNQRHEVGSLDFYATDGWVTCGCYRCWKYIGVYTCMYACLTMVVVMSGSAVTENHNYIWDGASTERNIRVEVDKRVILQLTLATTEAGGGGERGIHGHPSEDSTWRTHPQRYAHLRKQTKNTSKLGNNCTSNTAIVKRR